MVDAGTLQALAGSGEQTLVSRIRLFGESLGGNDVETGLFDFPINVCTGCLACSDPIECDDEPPPACIIGQH